MGGSSPEDDGTVSAAVGDVEAGPRAEEDLPRVDPSAYELGEEIGRGGLGRLVRARDRRLGRIVAVKRLHRLSAATEARFVREVKIAARLQHPGLVPVYEAGRFPTGEPFCAMKLVSGEPLKHVVARSRTLAERLALVPNVLACAEALAYAHSEGVIHRDVKPANIMVGAFGETQLIDWGLAKEVGVPDEPGGEAASGDSDMTTTGSVMGTPPYLAPEQARGELADARADVYALGAVLYYVLSGRPPYEGEDRAALLDRIRSGPPASLRAREPGVPLELAAVVAKAMAREPAERYPSARELAEDLRRFETGQLVAAHRYSAGQLVRRWLARNRRPVAVAAVALVTLAVLSVIGVSRIVAERDLARDRLLDSYEEQGRRLLVGGDALRGLAFLREVLERGRDTPAIRFLVRRGLDALAAQRAVLRRGEMVSDVALSPDAARALVLSRDGRMAIWDTAKGTVIADVAAHTDAARGVFSPDGTLVATGGPDGNAKLFRVTGELVHTLPHGARAPCVAFNRDGSMLATGSYDGQVRLWDVASGRLVRALDHGARVREVAFDPSGERVLSGGFDDGVVVVWDVRRGEKVHALTVPPKRVSALAFAAGGRYVTAAGNEVAVWDAATGARVADLEHPREVRAVAASADGTRLLTANADGLARVWEAATGRLVSVLYGHDGEVTSARFCARDTRILTGGSDRTARVWNAATGAVYAVLQGHEDAVWAIDCAKEGSVAVTGSFDRTARLWNLDASPILFRLESGRGLHMVDVSGARGLLLGTEREDRVVLWDVRTRKRLADFLQPEGGAVTAVFSDDGHRFVVAGWGARTARIYDVDDKALVRTLGPHGDIVRYAEHSPDGKRVVTACADGTATVWDANTGAIVAVLRGHRGKLHTASFHPDGTRIVTAGMDGTVRVFRTDSGVELRKIDAHGSYVQTAFYDRTGRRIVTASSDKTVKVWDADTGALLVAMEGHAKDVLSAVFSPAGDLVASVGLDDRVNLWDAAGGRRLEVLREHVNGVENVVFLDDDTMVTAGSEDGAILFWNVATDHRAAVELVHDLDCRIPFEVRAGHLLPRPISGSCQ